jgi:pimeloyl-ACP methyl ester carboxylesterase
VTERHRIPVADGESVVAVHHGAPSGRWFVCCHGFRSDKSGSYEGRCRRAVDEGYNAVRFDFRGYGESDGTFLGQTTGDKLDDLAAVVGHFDPDSCVLFGSSFGGRIAFHAATSHDRVVETLDVPVAVFHGSRDGSVDVRHSFGVAAALDADVLLEVFASEDHRFTRAAEAEMRSRLFDWLATKDSG